MRLSRRDKAVFEDTLLTLLQQLKRTISFHVIVDKLNKLLVSTKMFLSSSYQKYVRSTEKAVYPHITVCGVAQNLLNVIISHG